MPCVGTTSEIEHVAGRHIVARESVVDDLLWLGSPCSTLMWLRSKQRFIALQDAYARKYPGGANACVREPGTKGQPPMFCRTRLLRPTYNWIAFRIWLWLRIATPKNRAKGDK